MKLLKLQLENFRNYKSYSYEFDRKNNFTIIKGPNGKGKTNLLEAIYVLSLGKSFRAVLHEDLMLWGMDYLRVTGSVENDEETLELEVFYTNYPEKKKNFKKNGVNLKNSEYIGNLITVLFQPEDMNILYLSPQLRRRYMDILLSQTDKPYLKALIKYNKTLKQRNALLNEIRKSKFSGHSRPFACPSQEGHSRPAISHSRPAISHSRPAISHSRPAISHSRPDRESTSEKAKIPHQVRNDNLLKDLDAWDEELIKFGSTITEKRLELVKFLDEKLEKTYQSISGEKEKIHIKYKSKVVDQKEVFPLERTYSDAMASAQDKDILQAKTSVGPHRDDLVFFIDNKDITQVASRGEFRTLLLAIKLAEIDFIKQKTGQSPILLLDDVFSELDKTRQEKLLKAIKNCQTIIATTDTENIGKLAEDSALLELAGKA
ncbi:MAG: DNA replication/repair protein RecF [Candidatus Gracilibacteria bacterium]|jgi:DNA replication and repair protein RecF